MRRRQTRTAVDDQSQTRDPRGTEESARRSPRGRMRVRPLRSGTALRFRERFQEGRVFFRYGANESEHLLARDWMSFRVLANRLADDFIHRTLLDRRAQLELSRRFLVKTDRDLFRRHDINLP